MMKINDFLEGKQSRYIIAEVSQNHDGSLGQAHAFIDAVAKTGADAIKFQTHIADEESTLAEPFRVQFSYCDATRYDYWKRMEFTPDQWAGLFQHAIEKNLDFLSSPFSIKALQLLESIGVPAWKFGSGEIFNIPLLQSALSTGKPIIISDGLSTMSDIETIVSTIKKSGNHYIVLECTTAYPSQAENIPIRYITELKNRFDCPVGISDHSATIYPAIACTALGGSVVEVHVTLSHEMFGPDVKASVTTQELKQLVEGVDFVQRMLASNVSKDQLDQNRTELKNIFSKSLYAKQFIVAGSVIRADDIAIKKPVAIGGFSSGEYNDVVGRKAVVNIEKDEPFTKNNVNELAGDSI